MSQIMPLFKRMAVSARREEKKKKKSSMFQLQAIISNYTHSSAPGEKFLPPTLSVLHVDTGDCGLILEIASREEKKVNRYNEVESLMSA